MPEDLESYFAKEELDGASSVVQMFHGKLLIDNDLGRSEIVLIGIYMLSNYRKSNEVQRNEAKEFLVNRLSVPTEVYSKGLYDLKEAGLVTESDSKISLTFKGVKKVRDTLSTRRKA